MMNLASEQAKIKHKVGILSLEMDSQELIQRMFSSNTGIPFWKIKKNQLTEEEKETIRLESLAIAESGMMIIDNAFTLNQIKSKVKSLVKTK